MTQQPNLFCKNCKWISYWWHNPDYELRDCMHPNLMLETLNPVSGENDRINLKCRAAREDADLCGIEAKWYEAKENVDYKESLVLAAELPTVRARTPETTSRRKFKTSMDDLI